MKGRETAMEALAVVAQSGRRGQTRSGTNEHTVRAFQQRARPFDSLEQLLLPLCTRSFGCR